MSSRARKSPDLWANSSSLTSQKQHHLRSPAGQSSLTEIEITQARQRRTRETSGTTQVSGGQAEQAGTARQQAHRSAQLRTISCRRKQTRKKKAFSPSLSAKELTQSTRAILRKMHSPASSSSSQSIRPLSARLMSQPNLPLKTERKTKLRDRLGSWRKVTSRQESQWQTTPWTSSCLTSRRKRLNRKRTMNSTLLEKFRHRTNHTQLATRARMPIPAAPHPCSRLRSATSCKTTPRRKSSWTKLTARWMSRRRRGLPRSRRQSHWTRSCKTHSRMALATMSSSAPIRNLKAAKRTKKTRKATIGTTRTS